MLFALFCGPKTIATPDAVPLRRGRAAGRSHVPKGESTVIRYGFNIKTRMGQRVDNILIMAATQDAAERRLRQMYHHCEIVDCHEAFVPHRVDTLDVEGVIGLISRCVPSIQKPGTH
jgi:hypothetical protein